MAQLQQLQHFCSKIFLGLSATALLLSACSSVPTTSNTAKPDSNQVSSDTVTNKASFEESEVPPTSLNSFLAKVSQDQHIPIEDLQSAFGDAKLIPSIKKLVLPAPAGFQKNWRIYRSRFVEPKRLAAGQEFWQKHRAFIQKTADETGVDAEVIVSIIGIETIYGKQTGGFPVKNTLITLGFDYPETPNKTSREILFRNQLQDLITLCWRDTPKAPEFKSCLNQTGSYAGAIGLPQFMPGSILRYGVDGDRDGKIDLRNSPQDAIASVGNFLKQHGWVHGEPIYLPLLDTVQANEAASRLADGEPQAKFKLGDLAKEKIVDLNHLSEDTPSLIVDLPSPNNQGGSDIKYIVGLRNFIAICEYNRSFFYAQSVAEFAEILRPEKSASQETSAKKSGKKQKRASKKPNKKTTSHH